MMSLMCWSLRAFGATGGVCEVGSSPGGGVLGSVGGVRGGALVGVMDGGGISSIREG